MSDTLDAVAAEISLCTRCPLHEGRTNAVPGEGPANAEIMFIGEGPGFHEDRQGRPFVGASGNFLTQMMNSAGVERPDVFITNVVKCRPPDNRDPMPEEIEACREYLDRQIDIINPKAIVTLGRFSMSRWFPSARISRIHGQAREADGRLVVPFFHPAAALHQPSLRVTVEEDFAKLTEMIGKRLDTPVEDRDDSPPDDELKQLSMF